MPAIEIGEPFATPPGYDATAGRDPTTFATHDPHRLSDAVRLDLDRPDRSASPDVPSDPAAQHMLRSRGRLWRVSHNGLKAERLIEAGDQQEAARMFAAWAEDALGRTINADDCRAEQLPK